MEALLGEVERTKGQLAVSGDATWASQEPWICSGTVRDNVLLGEDLQWDRWRHVTGDPPE